MALRPSAAKRGANNSATAGLSPLNVKTGWSNLNCDSAVLVIGVACKSVLAFACTSARSAAGVKPA